MTKKRRVAVFLLCVVAACVTWTLFRQPSGLRIAVQSCEYLSEDEYERRAGQPGARIVVWVNVASDAQKLEPGVTCTCEARIAGMDDIVGSVWTEQWVRVSELPNSDYGLEACRRLMFRVEDGAPGDLAWSRLDLLGRLEAGNNLMVRVGLSTKMRRLADSGWVDASKLSSDLRRLLSKG